VEENAFAERFRELRQLNQGRCACVVRSRQWAVDSLVNSLACAVQVCSCELAVLVGGAELPAELQAAALRLRTRTASSRRHTGLATADRELPTIRRAPSTPRRGRAAPGTAW